MIGAKRKRISPLKHENSSSHFFDLDDDHHDSCTETDTTLTTISPCCPQDSTTQSEPPSPSSSPIVLSTSLLSSTTPLSPRRGKHDKDSSENHHHHHQDDSFLQYSPLAIRQTLFGRRRRPERFHHPHRGNFRFRRREDAYSIPLIPAEHPLKITWDLVTLFLSIVNAYATHTSIRDRQFANNVFLRVCEAWFALDILFNFMTEYKTPGMHLRTAKAVWARYLTTWFVVDLLSLFPAEVLYIQPIIDQQNRRGFLKKSFFRTKAVMRVTRFLRGHHFKYFGKVAKQTKRAVNVGAPRLLRLIIKYVPKYWLFLRNMKALAAVRLLRQIHWLRKVYANAWHRYSSIPMMTSVSNDALAKNEDDNDTYSTQDYDFDGSLDGYFSIPEHEDDDEMWDDDDDDENDDDLRWELFADDTSSWNDEDDYGPY